MFGRLLVGGRGEPTYRRSLTSGLGSLCLSLYTAKGPTLSSCSNWSLSGLGRGRALDQVDTPAIVRGEQGEETRSGRSGESAADAGLQLGQRNGK